ASRVLPTELLAQHSRHPDRVPPNRGSRRVHHPARPGRHPVVELRHLRTGSRTDGGDSPPPGVGGVLRLRAAPDPALGPGPPRFSGADHRPHQRDPSPASGPAAQRRAGLPRHRQRATALLLEAPRRRHDPRRGEPGPGARPVRVDIAGPRRSRDRPAQPVPGARLARRPSLPVARGPQLRRAGSPSHPGARVRRETAGAHGTGLRLLPMSDPRWYQEAIIYQTHVRAFQDSNNDGIGDFRGLTSRLDYLVDLGVTAVWLLPFYPSPLKDDGYDIADYTA